MELNAVKEVVTIAKRLDDKNLVNAYEGNVSVQRGGYTYITPSGKIKGFLEDDSICVLDEAGKQVAGKFAPSSELKMHAAIYKMRDNIGGIVHAHPPYLTAYAMCSQPFCNKAHAELLWDHKTAEIVPYGRPGSEEIFAGMKPLLDMGRNVVLLANHGVIAVGETVFEALNRIESVENAAKITVIAKMVGKLDELPEDEVQALLDM